MTTDQISQDSIVRVPIVGIVRIPVTDIERVPITGIERMPIVGVLQTEPTEELDWDNVYAQLVNYIKFAAKQVAQQYQTGAVNSAEDLFQEGQLLLYHCFTLYKTRPFNEFSALFKASLWRKLREIGSKKSFIQVDLEDAYDLGYSDDVVDDMYNEYRLQQVAEMLESSPIALTIFKEFINPSGRTVWEAEADVARKQTLQDQNYAISVPKSVQIKGVHIQRALEIPKVKFNECFKLVKDCVNQVYCQDQDYDEVTDEQMEEFIQVCNRLRESDDQVTDKQMEDFLQMCKNLKKKCG